MTDPRRLLARLLLALALVSCGGPPAGPPPVEPTAPEIAPPPAPPTAPTPPVAAARPHEVPAPAGTRTDEYNRLRDDTRKNQEVLDYLAAENAYKDAVLADTRAAQDLLFDEIVGRIQKDDSTVPARYRGHFYYRRYEQGKEYPIFARRKGTVDAPEEILLDANLLAEGKDYLAVGNTDVTEDGRLLAYAVDEAGRFIYTLRFKDLSTGAALPDIIPNADADLAWTKDGKAILYVEKDPVTLLGVRVRKHVLGTEPARDPVVYEEKDHSFYIGLEKGRSDRFIYIQLQSTVSSEVRYAAAGDPQLAFQVIVPRERDHEYQVEDLGDRFIIRTNWQAKNFRVVEVPIRKAGDRKAWRDVVPHREDAFVHGALAFKDHLVVSERSGGLRKIRIRAWKGGKQSLLTFEEPAYVAALGENPEQDTRVLRFTYMSPATPPSVYDQDMKTGQRTLKKREPVLGGYHPSRYAVALVFAEARDGQQIPVSIVHRKEVARDGTAPLYLYGYGSYGMSSEPWFSSSRVSLLDRGFVVATAHVRGGQEMGRRWYEDGKLLRKMNSFTDFVDVTDYLVKERWAAADKVTAMGGSAGGLLMGAIANLAPEKYRAIVAHVPFVDVVTTMLDESIPLTTNEFDEWGDPKKKDFYDYMLSYSPYDNVGRKAYPAMLVTTGLWDSQVQYWEPAKWVARLRARKTDRNPLLMHINMDAGHGGKSGRFRRHRETALEYAFLFKVLGIEVKPLSQ